MAILLRASQLQAKIPRFYLVTLLLANLGLLLPPTNIFRLAGIILLSGFLPGLSWARLLAMPPLLGWTTAAALSYSFTALAALLLHYLPGSIDFLPLWGTLNALALLPVLFSLFRDKPNISAGPPALRALIPLLLLLGLATFLRGTNLGYSEFQGDEALAMISAAEALEGHEDALFLRSKGPGELLLPLAMWRLNGVINEPVARLPFTIAALWAIMTIYLIGQAIGGPYLGWLAALFFSLNGFTVAFGRIVQYQALVLWFSSLAFLLALYWQQTRQRRFAFLSGLCLGTGLLAHYDAILVLPALAWLFLSPTNDISLTPAETQYAIGNRQYAPRVTYYALRLKRHLPAILLFLLGALLIALPFYLPYSLDPQANRAGAYVGGRIGNELRNNLPDFFHFNSFYSSFYYIAFTGLLVYGLLLWLLGRRRWGRWLALPVGATVLAVVLRPNLLAIEPFNFSFLPFVLLLGGAFFALPFAATRRQALIVWLAAPFLGYNFVVALGLTHIYTTVPAWSLLATLIWPLPPNPVRANLSPPAPPKGGESEPIPPSEGLGGQKSDFKLTQMGTWGEGQQLSISTPSADSTTFQPSNLPTFQSSNPSTSLRTSLPIFQSLITLLFTLLSTIFLWNAFVRHDVEYWQDYPEGNIAFFWSPYEKPPEAGFFGFAHRSGWKAVGQKIAASQLAGDYGSNEEPDVTTWYTRGAPRACDPRPEYYFLADDLIDPIDLPDQVIADSYQQIGQATLPNQKKMRIMQQKPTSLALGELDDSTLAAEFDQTATPAALARSARGARPLQVNFANLIQLIGYDLDTRRAYPGGRVPLTLYWQALVPPPAGYQIFTHLESEAAGLIAQADGAPVCWSYPTDLWRPGQIIADQHAIPIPAEAPPGDYPLQVGLYLADTFERLDILDEAGNPAGTSLVLEMVEIGEIRD